MRKYIVRRVLLMFPTALLATILVFSLMQLVPGDAADAALADLDVGSREQAEEFEEKLRERHGLNDSTSRAVLELAQFRGQGGVRRVHDGRSPGPGYHH